MNKKISVGIAVAFVLIAVTITFTAAMIFSMNLFDSKVLSAQGVDPVTVMKLDTANQQVKSVLETHKDTYTLEDGSRRHSFK